MPESRTHVVVSSYDDTGNPHYGGGGAVVVAQIAGELARDHRVTVVTGSYRGSGRSRVRDGVRYVFLPVGWAGPRGGQIAFQILLPLAALLLRPDAWIESVTPPFSASLLPLVARCPVVALVQMLSGADMGRRYGLPFEAVERRALRLYRHAVVLNETDRRAVRAANARASITVIPNGIARPPAADLDPGAGRHILFLGRVDVRQKGLDLLLDAVAARPGLPLVIAGSGTAQEEDRLRALTAAPGVADRVRVVGRVEGARKRELLCTCAFMVVPSRYETFCLSALEAMAHGKPVVHFALPQLDWIGPGSGVAVPPFDGDGLATAIAQLSQDAGLRARLGRGARERSADYDVTVTGEQYRSLVAGLARGAVPTPARGLMSLPRGVTTVGRGPRVDDAGRDRAPRRPRPETVETMIDLKVRRAAGAGSAVLVGGMALNAVLNYGFGVTLAWMLPQDAFGAVSVLQSVLLLAATVLAAGFPWALARTMARTDDGGARGPADAAFRSALLGNLVLGVALAAGLVAAQLATGRILPGAGPLLTLLMAAAVVLISVYSVLWGALHGTRCFDAIGATQLAETLVKVAGGLLLVGLCGFGVPGVATAVLAGIAVAVWLCCRALGERLPGRGPVAGASTFAAAAPMAVGTIGFGLLTTLDILVLSALGDGAGAGFAAVAVYQAAAVLARAPVLLSSALAEAMFPFIARGGSPAEAHRWFRAAFRWVPLAFVPLQLVLLITPGSVIGLLFPASYLPAADLARAITIGTTGLIVADMLLKALLARGLAAAVAARVPVAVAVELLASAVLVPRWGGLGAAAAFAAGAWTAAALLTVVYLRQHRPDRLRVRTVTSWLLALCPLAVALAAASRFPRPLDLVLVAAGLAGYVLAAVALGLVLEADLAALRTRLSRPVAATPEDHRA